MVFTSVACQRPLRGRTAFCGPRAEGGFGVSLDAGRLTRTSRGRAGGALLVAVSMVVALVAAAPAALAAEPGLVAVEAISAHRLLATFDQEPNAVALKATNYTITGPNGSSLAVLALSALGNKQALVSTAAMMPPGP